MSYTGKPTGPFVRTPEHGGYGAELELQEAFIRRVWVQARHTVRVPGGRKATQSVTLWLTPAQALKFGQELVKAARRVAKRKR